MAPSRIWRDRPPAGRMTGMCVGFQAIQPIRHPIRAGQTLASRPLPVGSRLRTASRRKARRPGTAATAHPHPYVLSDIDGAKPNGCAGTSSPPAPAVGSDTALRPPNLVSPIFLFAPQHPRSSPSNSGFSAIRTKGKGQNFHANLNGRKTPEYSPAEASPSIVPTIIKGRSRAGAQR